MTKKHWMIVLLALLVISVASIYIFIPGKLRISNSAVIQSSMNVANSIFLDENKWKSWWPDKGANMPWLEGYVVNNRLFKSTRIYSDRIKVTITKGGRSINTDAYIFPLNRDSTQIIWECLVLTGANPFERIRSYREAVSIKKDIAFLMQALNSFVQNTSNLYGFPMREIISKDSALVIIKRIVPTYPDNQMIYRLIDTLSNYISSEGAVQTNYPMLKITETPGGNYQVMVALPTSRMLPGNGIVFSQHFVPWKMLVATVNGGAVMIDSAFRQMEKFVEDKQRTSMAVPFELMITNRLQQPDSLQWKTLICQPVS